MSERTLPKRSSSNEVMPPCREKLLPEKLVEVTVVPVGVDHGVPLLEDRDESAGDRFLTDVEVQVPSDLVLHVRHARAVLEAADDQHLAVETECFLCVHSQVVARS